MTADQPFACDGSIGLEKLRELLAVQGETEALDYKSFLDLKVKIDEVEFAKDAAAMQSLPDGGYIIVGADGSGNPTDKIGNINPRDFDESRLRAKILKYVDDPLTLRSQVHEIDGCKIAIIYVGPNNFGFTIFRNDGQYKDNNGHNQTVFYRGDVFVRRGTSSERWRQSDLPELLHPYENRIREDERKTLGKLFDQLSRSGRGEQLRRGPIGSLNWRLDQDDFDPIVLDALRNDDTFVLRSFAFEVSRDAQELLRGSGDSADLEILTDRLAAAIGLTVTYGRIEQFNLLLDTLESIYWFGTDQYGDLAGQGVLNSGPKFWLDIGTKVEAIGGLAVRINAFWALRPLIFGSKQYHPSYASWLRHSLTMAARANLLVSKNRKRVPGSFIGFSRVSAARIKALHPDVSPNTTDQFEVGKPPDELDPLLDSIVQFDFLWCLATQIKTADTSEYYPSFIGFFARRTEPAIKSVIADQDERLRVSLLDTANNREIRDALEKVLESAREQSMSAGKFPWYVESDQISRFLYKGSD